jgi:hypothetical protein
MDKIFIYNCCIASVLGVCVLFDLIVLCSLSGILSIYCIKYSNQI